MRDRSDAARHVAAVELGSETSELAVLSRREALEKLADTLLTEEPSLTLLTGESGSGKSWLWRHLATQLPVGWHFLPLDLTAAIEPLDFHALIAEGLGTTVENRLAAARSTMAQTLRDEARDGRSWILVLENVQSAAPPVRAELLALSHAMEAGEGFAAILLIGPTSLSRLLETRDWKSLAARIGSHVHLLPLDLDECRELVQQHEPATLGDARGLELLHRDAAGNPRRILHLLSARRGAIESRRVARTILEEQPAPSTTHVIGTFLGAAGRAEGPRAIVEATATEVASRVTSPQTSAYPSPAQLLPSRPPLRVEEGLVEVGWPGSLEAESTSAAEPSEEASSAPGSAMSHVVPAGEEIIEDHYAALQAWNEWAQNRGRTLEEPAESGDQGTVIAQEGSGPTDQEEPSEQDSARRVLSGLRAEPQHEHAPYSQLFSKLRQSN